MENPVVVSVVPSAADGDVPVPAANSSRTRSTGGATTVTKAGAVYVRVSVLDCVTTAALKVVRTPDRDSTVVAVEKPCARR